MLSARNTRIVADFSSGKAPQHKVTISKPFAVGRFPVTCGEFAAFVKETGQDRSR